MGAKKGRGAVQAPLIVTAKDIQILRFLAMVRVGTAKDVAYALASRGSLTTIRSRLTTLAGGADYQPRCVLYRFPLPSVNGNPERAYCVGQKGFAHLASELGWSRERSIKLYKARVVSHRLLRHTLAVTSCVASARMFARSRPDLSLRDCLLSDELGRVSPTLPVIPDMWMRWEKPEAGRTLGLWVEVDCATEWQAAWAKIFRARVDFIRSGGCERTFGVPRVLLCYVVVGQTAQAGEIRRQTLCRWAIAVLKAREVEKWTRIVRVTSVLLDEVYEQGLFEKPVWYRPDSDTPVPLFSP
jgi:hypothetical protein